MRKLLAILLLTTAGLLAAPATLTQTEIAEGWILLFDGETMFGWSQELGARWRVENGALISSGAGYLRTNAAFGDFHLKCEFLGGSGAGSGVFLRFDPREGDPGQSGYEVQLDNNDFDYPTGSIVGHVRSSRARIARNRWHRLEVRAEADQLLVVFDGEVVVDEEVPHSRVGHIGLESGRNGDVRFRNLKLRPLDMDQLFNGRDLSGWTIVMPAPKEGGGGIGGMIKKLNPIKSKPKEPQWSVANGMIQVADGPGELVSGQTYDNFIAQVRFRTLNQGNDYPKAGVLLRADPQQYLAGYEVQIHNELKNRDPSQPAEFGTGGIRDLQRARRVIGGPGEIVTQTIVAWKRRISVWVNGYPVTDFQDPRPEGVARVAAGPLGLYHDSGTEFAAVSAAALVEPPPAVAQAPPAAGGQAPAAPGGAAPQTPQPQAQVPMPGPGPGGGAAPAPQQPAPAPAPQVVVQPPPGMTPQQKAQVAQLTIQAARTQDPVQRAALYEQVLIQDPTNQAAAAGLQAAHQEITQAQAEEAQRIAEQVQQAEEERQQLAMAEVAVEQARGAWLRGDIPEAEKHIAEAKSYNPDDPEIARIDPLIQAEVRKRWAILIGLGVVGLIIVGALVIWFFRSRGKKTPYLLIVDGEDKGKRFDFTGDKVHIGAVEESGGDRNEITIRDLHNQISRFHCEIHRQNGKFFLVDCRSTNGTYLGSKRLEPGQAVPIKGGARIGLAKVCTLMLQFEKKGKVRLPGGIVPRPSRPSVPRPNVPRPRTPKF